MDVNTQLFTKSLWEYYELHKRSHLVWRKLPANPYHIVVSEIMLQQTQVPRVIPKFDAFITRFPDWQALSEASLADVLQAWSVLGYNRRAKYLHGIAQTVIQQYAGVLPNDRATLETLPGIGKNTAGAILAYAYNEPALFIETNVRTAYIHHFFSNNDKVSDAELMSLLQQTVPKDMPREFYWALMDYGSFLKQSTGNASRRSAEYKVQSKFEGSRRQLRGMVLRALSKDAKSEQELLDHLQDVRGTEVLQQLTKEGLITRTDDMYQLG